MPPYFWVLIALGVFELVNFIRTRGAPGTQISMGARVLSFVLAVVLMYGIAALAGYP